MTTTIDILCASGTNGARYAEYFKRTAELLSTSDCDFRWKHIWSLDRDNKHEKPNGFIDYGIAPYGRDQGSINHTIAMHELLKHADADFTIIADIDLAMLKKGWDKDVLEYLKTYDCFGIGWGKWDRKYLKFPCIMFIAFETKLLDELDWDLGPVVRDNKDACTRYEATERDARFCGVKPGTVIKQDSGWRIPYLFQENGKTGFAINKYKVGSKKSQLPFSNAKQKKLCMSKPTHQSEYILNGELWASHLQACRSKPFNGSHASSWTWRCNRYIKDKYGIVV